MGNSKARATPLEIYNPIEMRNNFLDRQRLQQILRGGSCVTIRRNKMFGKMGQEACIAIFPGGRVADAVTLGTSIGTCASSKIKRAI